MSGILLRSQTNYFFTVLSENGLDAREFRWEESAGSVQLLHVRSGYRFCLVRKTIPGKLGTLVKEYEIAISPGLTKTVDLETCNESDWDKLSGLVGKWAGNLARELLVPDLWESIQATETLGRADDPVENSRFTPDEQAVVLTAIEEVRRYVKRTGSLDAKQQEQVDRNLDYAAEAARRVGRRDWRNIFIAQLVNLVVQQLTDPNVLKVAWTLVRTLFGDGSSLLPS